MAIPRFTVVHHCTREGPTARKVCCTSPATHWYELCCAVQHCPVAMLVEKRVLYASFDARCSPPPSHLPSSPNGFLHAAKKDVEF